MAARRAQAQPADEDELDPALLRVIAALARDQAKADYARDRAEERAK